MLEEAKLLSIEKALASHNEVEFAYLHGSSLFSNSYKDIDIAVYLSSDYTGYSSCFDVSIPLELELEKQINRRFDVQILNFAPLAFRFRIVSQGTVVIDRSPKSREIFELLSRVKYFDFKSRKQEYLKEALS